MNKNLSRTSGFTLIELSIVLMIIGLIVGGILSGRDLIDAAAQRAQISQIEKYNVAVQTFQNKYGYLPGDIPNPYATNFGFQTRGNNPAQGDGNGVVEGNCGNSTVSGNGQQEGCGELAVFWEDISEAGLIDKSVFGKDTKGAGWPDIVSAPGITLTTSPAAIKDWLPIAKIGPNDEFVYVYSINGENYFSAASIVIIGWTIISDTYPGLTVQQAYNIDKKIDDGLPQSGSVTACYVNFNVIQYSPVWAAGNSQQGASGGSGSTYTNNCIATTVATPYAVTNCFDNNNAAGAQKYSLSQNANLQNCALSFKFQ